MTCLNNKIVVLEGITKSYSKKKVLDDLSLSINKNSIVSILGTSGCGKTTLLNIMSGVVEPDNGKVYLEGVDVTGTPGFMSYMMQKDLLLEYKTAIENVAIPLMIKGEKKRNARELAKEYFQLFELSEIENKYPRELSGGMRQRIAFLRTYVTTKKVALLDEPFSALDELTKKNIYEWFLSVINKINLTVVFITHNVDEAIHLSDSIYVLNQNKKQLTPVEKSFSKNNIIELMISN